MNDMVELLILIAVAVGVLFYLRSIIGTRTGHEGPPSTPFDRRAEPEADKAPPPDQGPPVKESETVGKLDKSSAEALKSMREAEPDFDLDRFLEGARAAYETILMAYEEGNRETLTSLLAPNVLAAFESVIDKRAKKKLRVEARFVGVRDIRTIRLEYEAEMREADVTLRFVSEMVSAVYDKENRVVEGDPNEVRRQTDIWTFSRVMGSQNPNWLLTATGE